MDIKILLQALNQPWMIHPSSAEVLALAAHKVFSGESISLNETKVKDFCYVVDMSGKKIGSITDAVDNGVAVINLQGAVMKYDYCGAAGTKSMMRALQQANDNPSISAIVLNIDSPGGSVAGTQEFANAIKNSAKPVVAFADGMMCSAAMWIGSAATMRIASADTAVIGSIGTMCSWNDFKGYYEQMGIKTHEVYATDSSQKNLGFREAEGNNATGTPNYEPLIKTWLDPLNSIFTGSIKDNLPNADKTVLNGSHYIATEAKKKGLIDAIGTFEIAVNKALQLAAANKQIIQQQKENTMNIKWKTLLSKLGFEMNAADPAAETKLEDSHADAIDAIVSERDQLKTALSALQATHATVVTASAEKDSTITNLNEQIIALGKKDGAEITSPKKGKDKAEETETGAMEMGFQQDLLNKLV